MNPERNNCFPISPLRSQLSDDNFATPFICFFKDVDQEILTVEAGYLILTIHE